MMRWMIWMVVFGVCAACSNEGNAPQPSSNPEQIISKDTHPQKTADVKTETGAEHFGQGIPTPESVTKLMKTTPEASPSSKTKDVVSTVSKTKDIAEHTITSSINTVTGTVWKKCKMCHTFTAKSKVGPGLGKGNDGLTGIFGRKAGIVPGFHYTFVRYIKDDGWIWDESHLRKWMCNSTKAIKEFTHDTSAKTKMISQHICKREDQDSVLSKLKEISK